MVFRFRPLNRVSDFSDFKDSDSGEIICNIWLRCSGLKQKSLSAGSELGGIDITFHLAGGFHRQKLTFVENCIWRAGSWDVMPGKGAPKPGAGVLPLP